MKRVQAAPRQFCFIMIFITDTAKLIIVNYCKCFCAKCRI